MNARLLIGHCLWASNITVCQLFFVIYLFCHFDSSPPLLISNQIYEVCVNDLKVSIECVCETRKPYRDHVCFWCFWVCVHVCACVTICVFWVMGFVHPLSLTARMYPWQRQVDPSCELVRGTWKGALNLSAHLPCALLALTMAKRMALLKSQPQGYIQYCSCDRRHSHHNTATFWPDVRIYSQNTTVSVILLFYFPFSLWIQGSSVETNMTAKSTRWCSSFL